MTIYNVHIYNNFALYHKTPFQNEAIFSLA